MAQAGDENVVLQLLSGGALHVRAVDANGGACKARFVVSAQPPGIHLGSMLKWEDSRKFEAIPEGFYDVAASTEDGRAGIARHVFVESGATAEEVVVPVEPGGRVRIRYEGKEEYAQYRVYSGDAVVAADGIRTGTSDLHVVPAGTLIAKLSIRGEEDEERRISVLVGEETEVWFRRE
jgi:hypothetical protein